MSINQFMSQFNKEYDFLLHHSGNVSGVREAVQWYELNFDNNLPLIREVVKQRKEGIDTSNEKATFAFACETLNIGE